MARAPSTGGQGLGVRDREQRGERGPSGSGERTSGDAPVSPPRGHSGAPGAGLGPSLSAQGRAAPAPEGGLSSPFSGEDTGLQAVVICHSRQVEELGIPTQVLFDSKSQNT